MKRRSVLKSIPILGAAAIRPASFQPAENPIIGHGDFRYRVHRDWGTQDLRQFPIQNCHEMVEDAQGRLILLTDHPKNNILVYDRSGKVVDSWTLGLPGGHGLTLQNEGGEDFLYITDAEHRHRVFKTTLDGRVILELTYPREIPDYRNETDWKPTETTVLPNGDFLVADGYGLDFVIRYDAKGNYLSHFGGKGGGAHHLSNAHGVAFDNRQPGRPLVLVTSRSEQKMKRYHLDGTHHSTLDLPGASICRPVVRGENLYFAVIVTDSWWSYDGMVYILDKNDRVVSAPGGSAPVYTEGVLQEAVSDKATFFNPHDVCVDRDENIYVAQWYSGRTYPIKLERV